jgi:hypothetical protein
VVVVALIVARPVVSGEDPGLLSDLSDPASLVLTLLTLVAAAAWSGWRLWTRQSGLRAGRLEGAFLLLVLVLAVSAGTVAAYRRPAWLLGWEWAGLWVLFFLVRQLTAGAEEQHGFLAVLLAGALALSVSGLYQAVFELPAAARVATDPDELRKQLAERGETPTDADLERIALRLRERAVSATFTHPSSLAGYLVLLLPGLVGAVVACVRGGASAWLTGSAGLAALLAGVVLCLTQCWPAILICLLLGVGVGAWGFFSPGWPRVGGVLIGLAVLAAVGWVLVMAGVPDESALAADLAERRALWAGTWRLLGERFWLGVGPGQFGSVYPRFMLERAAEKPVLPHNFLFELWTAGGVLALLVMLALLALLFGAVRRWQREAGQPPRRRAALPEGPAPASGAVRWEYYLGGMLGVLLGFVLRAAGLPREEIVGEALSAGLRSVAWFAGFALYERIAWTDGERVTVLAAGVVGCLAYWLTADGVSFPSVAGPFWVVVALLMGIVAPAPSGWTMRERLGLTLPVPVLSAVALVFFLFVLVPVATAASTTRRALNTGRYLLEKMRKREIKKPEHYLRAAVITPLQEAARDDPDNARIRIHLAQWYGELWARNPSPRKGEPAERAVHEAVENLKRAKRLNPNGAEVFLAEYQLHLRATAVLMHLLKLVQQSKMPPQEKKKQAANLTRKLHIQRKLASDSLQRLVRLDPTDAPLRFRLADVLFASGDAAQGRKEAEEAQRLDRCAARPWRELTDPQREQVRRWLATDADR